MLEIRENPPALRAPPSKEEKINTTKKPHPQLGQGFL